MPSIVVIANYGIKDDVRSDCEHRSYNCESIVDLIVQFCLSKYVEFLEGVHHSPFACYMNDVHDVCHRAYDKVCVLRPASPSVSNHEYRAPSLAALIRPSELQ
jgi:hypothetical protein